MSEINLSLLKPHPLNSEIYGDAADADLVESIESNGILTPILITGDKAEIGPNVIISGHRRYYAAKKLDAPTVPVIISDLTDAMDIEEALIVANKQRAKDNYQTAREAEKMASIERERAKQRISIAVSASNAARPSMVNLPHLENTGTSRDAVGNKIGVSGSTAERMIRTVTVYDDLLANGEVERAEEIRSALNKSVNAGYNAAKVHIETERNNQDQAANKSTFNATNDNIEWAKWSWNPVTGCKHGCPYCYARDIAMRYTGHFNPEFHADRLKAPVNTKIPEGRKNEPGIKNVFVCSMADLFGAWVPADWINAVLKEIEAAPQWNFILLTKNPKRYLEFEYPVNCWVGATADTQARANAAIDVFQQLSWGKNRRPSVLFLSCEPLSERIDLAPDAVMGSLDWLIIGGRSRSSKLPEAQPEWEWVENLFNLARKKNIKLYFKPNLTVQPKEYPTL